MVSLQLEDGSTVNEPGSQAIFQPEKILWHAPNRLQVAEL